MSPREALSALTAVAASACSVAAHKGRMASSSDADIIAVEREPLEDPDALEHVSAVWRAGTRVH
jgi:imidazolonepropionase-like amidohydrolase